MALSEQYTAVSFMLFNLLQGENKVDVSVSLSLSCVCVCVCVCVCGEE